MKRRTFITATICGSLLGFANNGIAVPKFSAASIRKREERQLFQRFFKVATGFDAVPMQMFWFDQFKCGSVQKFTGARRTGMTTFMLVLALFEKKVNRNNIAIFPQHSAMNRMCVELVAEMELRLGMSVRDGQIFWGWDHEAFDTAIRGHRAKGFFMADAGFFPLDTPKRIASFAAPKESHYYFGTYEPTLVGKPRFEEGYMYCPYIPKTPNRIPIHENDTHKLF